MKFYWLALVFIFSFGISSPKGIAQKISLSNSNLELINVKAENVKFKSKRATRITGIEKGEQLAIIKGSQFKNGTIEIELAGQPLPDIDQAFRGFIGLAFRVQQSDSIRYECFYLRPTNGRAEDQLRRNHSTQYISHPSFPWFKLRQEFPGAYESYTDLVPGQWTKIKITVKDEEARLFINDVDQPCLIVKDLKGNISEGGIALWIGPGTEGYFSNLRIYKPKP